MQESVDNYTIDLKILQKIPIFKYHTSKLSACLFLIPNYQRKKKKMNSLTVIQMNDILSNLYDKS